MKLAIVKDEMFMHGTRRKFSRLLNYRETHGELGCLLQ